MSESAEIKRALDYQIGDLVQILTGEKAGSLGRILNIRLSTRHKFLVYEVYVKSDDRLYDYRGDHIRFLSHQDEE
jgi:ribosomal protein S4E